MRLGMFLPEMMEYLTASDANAMQVSLEMVEKAEIYLGVIGFRYGYVPADDNPEKSPSPRWSTTGQSSAAFHA
jgi:hypothetical protein